MERLVTKVSPKVKLPAQHEIVRSRKPLKYWGNQENINKFLSEIQKKYNLNTPKDWDSITTSHFLDNGGSSLISKYSIYELKCMACPEGKSFFKNPKQSIGYWKNEENILKFLSDLKEKYNLNSAEDWNSITQKQIKSNGGWALLSKYSIFDLKCMACPEGKSIFKTPKHSTGYWENKENIHQFLADLKVKYNLNTPEDWNSITKNQILENGGRTLAINYSIFELKCMACPEGKSIFNFPRHATGYWNKKENIDKFLADLKTKYNLNTPEDWNSITREIIISNGGTRLLNKFSMYELKCMACPDGKLMFDRKIPDGYWENRENIDKFLFDLKEKYNLNTPEDWNSITQNCIRSNGGWVLLSKYSIFDLKCMACPEGKSIFKNPPHLTGYWENKENIHQFLADLKVKYNLNTPEDWNSITHKQIQLNGGNTLSKKFSIYEIKCMACPEGKSIFNNPRKQTLSGYWEDNENVMQFFDEIKEKYNLNTPEDWKRISKRQIISHGGSWLYNSNKYLKTKIEFETPNGIISIPFSKLISGSKQKRSSQRWLFLQIQKLFPQEEIVEDYFHSEISRISGANVQFDIFMIQRNIAIEYHGVQHYEDIPFAFANLETYKHRDIEKGKLCEEHGIQLVVIPYWWDNKLDSLKNFLYSKINI